MQTAKHIHTGAALPDSCKATNPLLLLLWCVLWPCLLPLLLVSVCCRELDRQAGRREGTEEDMLAYLQERYK